MPFDIGKKKILIIDDFGQYRAILGTMLTSLGATDIEEASDGDSAIGKIANKRYDIILCDYRLGSNKKDGQQLLEEVKQRGLIRYSTIFMMITAENLNTMVMGAIEYKPDDYLIKPFSRKLLQIRLENLLEMKSGFEAIETAIDRDEYQKALSLCDERLRSNPANLIEFLRLKSELCIKMGRYTDAVTVFENILSIKNKPWAKSGLGKVSFLSKDYAKAIEIFEELTKENETYVEGYDWLAKAYEKVGDLKKAQETLLAAAQISPKAIIRQKELGKVALKNRDYGTAEDTFKTVIKMGKLSYFRSPADYTGLAKVLAEKGDPDKALTVLKDLRSEFSGSPDASLQAAMEEGNIYKKINREEDAGKAFEEATRIFDDISGKVSTDVAVDFAMSYFSRGEKEKGSQLAKDIIRNNHDNEDVIGKMQGLFDAMDMQEEGKRLIDTAIKEVIDVNNKGVHLLKEGKFEQAIDNFEKAAKALPKNKVINSNAAHALLIYMEHNGKDDSLLDQARMYLDRIRVIDPAYDRYQKLLGMFDELAESKPLS